MNICGGIKLLCDTSRNAVKLYSVQIGIAADIFGHCAEKVTDTHCRLNDFAAIKAHIIECGINGVYNCWACVMGVHCGDKVRAGGVVAFVTSKGTLDKENPEVRKYLAERAELLGAIRLPNNAFKANAL